PFDPSRFVARWRFVPPGGTHTPCDGRRFMKQGPSLPRRPLPDAAPKEEERESRRRASARRPQTPLGNDQVDPPIFGMRVLRCSIATPEACITEKSIASGPCSAIFERESLRTQCLRRNPANVGQRFRGALQYCMQGSVCELGKRVLRLFEQRD